MQRSSRALRDLNAAEACVTIRRTVEDTFGFYRDFTNLPRFLGDVMNVEETGPGVSRWTIQGPLGIPIKWTIRVLEERANELIRYETVASTGLSTCWEVSFRPGPEAGQTEVREVIKTPFGRLGRVGLALMGRPPAGEVQSNLQRLKELLEDGVVTHTEHAVAGKFARDQ
ncbi:SRPBCC family protein [Micromonospora sp. STR1_7]|uniref:SRPBCC family protein n=1 Tax=Micromonospora parastrephiae TaxID=2806101 RepID=A0ABS1XRY7_9ACTN|nr:SRPBCC family protein [Micromonospora parastrephiae]MBM0232036.1 SRPBCC family protein [Micromonospora parastrephiae]